MSDSTHSEKLTLPEQLRAWSGNSFGPYLSPLPEMLAAADEIERLQHDLSRSVEATTQYLNEVERLRAALDLAITQLGDRPSHTNCRFAKDTLRMARGEIVAGDMQGSCLSAGGNT